MLAAIGVIFMTSCIINVDSGSTGSYEEVLYCENPDPYWIAENPPEFCADLVDEWGFNAGTCCYWYAGPADCYEEWCSWGDICSWEYSSVDCYAYSSHTY